MSNDTRLILMQLNIIARYLLAIIRFLGSNNKISLASEVRDIEKSVEYLEEEIYKSRN